MAKTRFTSPVGRQVQGSVDEPQTKDAQGNPRIVKTGPNAGQPNPQFFIAVAFPKADPQGEFAAFWQVLVAQAAADFPNLFPQGPGGPCVHPNFSFKYIDGDGRDQNGKPNAEKEGFAGHHIIRFASSYPPRCFHAGRYAAHEQIQEKGAIKRGYFVRVSGSVEGNGNAQRPGLYVNLDMVELSAYGPEIVSGPDASQAFGAGPAALPAGATSTPVGAPPPPAAPPAPGFPAFAPPAAPAPAAALPGSVSAPPPPVAPPYPGYMEPGAPLPGAPTAAPSYPPATAAPPAPPSAPAAIASPTSVRQLTAAAGGSTYEQLIAAGWTDETLRKHGLML